MAAPNSVHDQWPPTHQLSLDLGIEVLTSPEALAIAAQSESDLSELTAEGGANARLNRGLGWRVRPPTGERLRLRSPSAIGEGELQYLEQELSRTRAQCHQQSKRIRHLEQALDQTLVHLDSVREQLQDQHILENQLAAVEDYANVQQQAIVRLKRQLADQQASLNALQGAPPPTAAGSPDPPLKHLSPSLDSYSLSSEFAGDIARVLAAAQAHIESLNTEVEERTTFQARLQHTCQELATEREQLNTRMGTLEQQNAELQEQILKQMKQISDYETGLQHWRDRHDAAQQQLSQLRKLVEHFTRSQPDLAIPDHEAPPPELPHHPDWTSPDPIGAERGHSDSRLDLDSESRNQERDRQLLDFLRRFRQP